MAEPLLSIQDLHTYFYTEGGVARAVDGVSLQIGAGETVGLVGESGCGKSVTAMSVLRLIQPPGRIEAGSKLIFEGRDLMTISDRELREIRGARIAMVFQEPMTALNPVFTVGDQIAEVVRIHGGSRREAWGKAVEMLGVVGIPSPAERAKDYPHQLSGGMRQRAALARMMANEPDVLLMDEPLAALDAQTRIILQDELLRIWGQDRSAAERRTVVFITHAIDEAVFLADRVAVMASHPGRLKAIIDVDLPRPRNDATRAHPKFQALSQHIWSLIRDEAYRATVT
jgi:ABC-type dipeptide/oligopeptide/nickel transport system ATPase component